MDINRIIEILEDITMIDRRGAIDAADEIMAQLMAEQRAAEDERGALRAIARIALAYDSPLHYDMASENYESVYRQALEGIAGNATE